jgi:hypothetical protein
LIFLGARCENLGAQCENRRCPKRESRCPIIIYPIYNNFLLYNYFQTLKKLLFNSNIYYNLEKLLQILLKYSKNNQSIVIRNFTIIIVKLL